MARSQFASRTSSGSQPRPQPSSRPPRRRIALSQNFVRDSAVVDTLLDRSSIGPDDVVYEIGPGEGTITERLAWRCRHVVAVEKDPRLAERLRRRFTARPNVTVFLDDGLTFPLPVTRYKVFANVPFNVTAGIITRLTQAPNPPEDAYLGVQREAAQRYVGCPAETLVSVLLKPDFEPAIVHRFARRDFVPQPGVDVVLLRLRKRGPPLLAPAEAPRFRDFVAYGFTAWRPSLREAYAGNLDAQSEACLRERTGHDLSLTPTALPFDAWLALFHCFEEQASAPAKARIAGTEARLRGQQARLQKQHRTRTRTRPSNPPKPANMTEPREPRQPG
jgi:23S rRNA (adenine-N6)-dimethyltransferase